MRLTLLFQQNALELNCKSTDMSTGTEDISAAFIPSNHFCPSQRRHKLSFSTTSSLARSVVSLAQFSIHRKSSSSLILWHGRLLTLHRFDVCILLCFFGSNLNLHLGRKIPHSRSGEDPRRKAKVQLDISSVGNYCTRRRICCSLQGICT